MKFQSIEFFFFAALIFGVTIIFGIMSFFYKYVDLSGQDDASPSGGSPYLVKNQDESSALVSNGVGGSGDQKQPYATSPPYVTDSEGDSFLDKDRVSGEVTRSESEF